MICSNQSNGYKLVVDPYRNMAILCLAIQDVTEIETAMSRQRLAAGVFGEQKRWANRTQLV